MILRDVVDKHEMERRFATGEVFSKSFSPYSNAADKQKALELLNSGDIHSESSAIEVHKKMSRGPFIDSLPKDTIWYLANLSLSEDEFVNFLTINDKGWNKYTKGTQRLIDAAIFLQANPIDTRVTEIISAFNQGKIELCGITLLGRTIDGPFTIVEGTARLVAMYLTCVHKKICPLNLQEIELVLGLSKTNWIFE